MVENPTMTTAAQAAIEAIEEARRLHRNLLRVYGRTLRRHDMSTMNAFALLGDALARYDAAVAELQAKTEAKTETEKAPCSTTP
jgi:hypothetical protein